MEWKSLSGKLAAVLQKYRYPLAVVLAGLLLMWLPQKKTASSLPPSPTAVHREEKNVEKQLQEILGQIQGVGRVSVFLTEEAGKEVIYQENEDRSQTAESTSVRRDTVLLTRGQEEGLIRQTIPERYRGVIVVCQGGDRAEVRLNVTRAVSRVTGLRTDCICVLKMK